MEDIEEIMRVLNDTRRELKTIRELVGKVIFYITDAESEVTEKMRRFTMYMHDVHDITYMYEQRGLPIPLWILKEMERCDDRFRQLLDEAHAEGNVFARVRATMASDPLNKWDHTRVLEKPRSKENGNEAR
jgi:hypothetical protein